MRPPICCTVITLSFTHIKHCVESVLRVVLLTILFVIIIYIETVYTKSVEVGDIFIAVGLRKTVLTMSSYCSGNSLQVKILDMRAKF